MNGLNNSNDDVAECPLCMEPLEVDDLNFYPCTCGYQICRFCWHRIRTDENELCPACRKAYPENPADFTPLSQEQISALKLEKRQRDQQRKQKITENRKHLANVRVVQKNLVFVVGLPPRLADADILKKHEYFGKYGKIHKVVINPSTTYAGVQGPSASAYVTYVHNNDALRAIQSVNNIMIDGRLIKTSLGTTKYCSHFMKNQQCPKSDCMYLHELGDPEASFTKEEMHQGKHQEYEKRLHDALIASSNGSATTIASATINTSTKNGDTKLTNGTVQSKEAWPSLSTSPVSKETIPIKGGKGKENGSKIDRKHDKLKGDTKKGQKKQQSNPNNHNINGNSNKENTNGLMNGTKDPATNGETLSNGERKTQKQYVNTMSADEEINIIDDIEKDALSDDGKNADTRSLSSSSSGSSSTSESSSTMSNNGDSGSLSDSASTHSSGKSSPGSFPDHLSSNSLSTTTNDTITNLNNHQLSKTAADTLEQQTTSLVNNSADKNNCVTESNSVNDAKKTAPSNLNSLQSVLDTQAALSKLSIFDDNNSFFSSNTSFQPFLKGQQAAINGTSNNQLNSAINSHLPDLLNGIDGFPLANGQNGSNMLGGNSGSNLIDNPDKYLLSLNTTEDWEAAFKYVMMRNNKQLEDQQEEYLHMQELQKRNNLVNSMGGMSQLNGLHDFNNDFFQNGTDINRLSQAALFQQQQQQQQQQVQQRQQQPPQQNGMHHTDHLFGGTNMSKFFDFHKTQQTHNQHQPYMMNGHSNGVTNEHRDHLSMATLLENNRVNSQYLEHTNGLVGPQLQKPRLLNKFDQMGVAHTNHANSMLLNQNSNSSPQQVQQQSQPQHQQQPQLQHQHQPISRINNQFQQNPTVDDDLGFDPFIETQKALAELVENEMVQQPIHQQQPPPHLQQQQQNNQQNHNKHMFEMNQHQRSRMPPPGFNHMNAFGFGVPRAQGSKILPFMNMGGNNQQQQLQQQHQPTGPQQHNNWNQHMGFPSQQMNEHPQAHFAQQNGGTPHSKTDWTTMDPAILSFRQFPSYNGPQQHQQPQHTAPDMFMPQHLTQQSVQQPQQGFGHHGLNLGNNLLNPQQQNSPAQVNYSHTNWLNNEQNMFMNSLANGYPTNQNNFDKTNAQFTIPMPPGFHGGNKQQKAECIN